jgi:hypothetical protein
MIFILTLSSGMNTVFFISRCRKPAGTDCHFYDGVRTYFSFLLFNFLLLLTYLSRSFFCPIARCFDVGRYRDISLNFRLKIIHSYNINPLYNCHR